MYKPGLAVEFAVQLLMLGVCPSITCMRWADTLALTHVCLSLLCVQRPLLSNVHWTIPNLALSAVCGFQGRI